MTPLCFLYKDHEGVLDQRSDRQETVLLVDEAEIKLISGIYCTLKTCERSAHGCQSDCSVWFDRKWIPWKQDVATGVRHWK